jgi:hypothetical protein
MPDEEEVAMRPSGQSTRCRTAGQDPEAHNTAAGVVAMLERVGFPPWFLELPTDLSEAQRASDLHARRWWV